MSKRYGLTPNSISAMNAISLILRTREEFAKAVDYLQAILKAGPEQRRGLGQPR